MAHLLALAYQVTSAVLRLAGRLPSRLLQITTVMLLLSCLRNLGNECR
jgi:hypothetical protein